MLANLRVPWMFFVRDARIEVSYKFNFVLRVVSAVLNVAIYYFIARAFSGVTAPYLEAYRGNYFAFVIIGVAFSEYMGLGIGSAAASIRDGQMTGTLELMLLSPTRVPVMLLSSSLWSYAFATVRVLIYLAAGMALGMDLGHANIPLALLAIGVSIASFYTLGLFVASLAILIKRGDPLGWAIRVSSLVLGGVYYPVDVLPGWLRLAGQALPLTHSLELLRRSLLVGEGLDQLWGELLTLIVMTAVLLPLGLLACRLAIRIARTDGSLGHY